MPYLDAGKIDSLIQLAAFMQRRPINLEDLYYKIAATALQMIPADMVMLWSIGAQKKVVELRHCAPVAHYNGRRNVCLAFGEGAAGWCVQHVAPLAITVAADDWRYDQERNLCECELISILVVPVIVGIRCIGAIEYINHISHPTANSQTDNLLARLLATQVGLAMELGTVAPVVKLRAEDEPRPENKADAWEKQMQLQPLIYTSTAIAQRLKMVEHIAATDASVLIMGESGVGKELFAEQIHAHSTRRAATMVRVNCAALPDSILESELFGQVEGAFTDARERRGRFELAHGGSIFLDEIGALPQHLQGKMLRILQYQTFEKVGASHPTQVDVRIIAATNRDIYHAVEKGEFRRDLYYRLNVLPLTIPPLREHREDIPVLADHFLQLHATRMERQILGYTKEARQTMWHHDWPGNVRELRNAVERAVVTAGGDRIQPGDLALTPRTTGDLRQDEQRGSLRESMLHFKRQVIRNALERNSWNQTAAARMLQVQRTYLSKLIREMQIGR